MKEDYKVELGRKLVHFTSILIILIYVVIGQYSHRLALLTLTLILVLLIEMEYIRLEAGGKTRLIRFISRFKREKEKEQLGGDVFFMIGAILCLAIFDFRIAVAAILMTTFGDMTAALVGRRFGKHKLNKSQKSWEGTIAGLIVNLIIGMLFLRATVGGALWFLQNQLPAGNVLWPVLIVMALTASVTEVLINKLDDNLLVPLFSGFNGQIVLIILNISIIPI
ncbi:MAG: SEC59/DGK1/VTE5 family protein [Nanoarchaeota archaeon]|nr:SEC59/DGK1/VTE5 family protein [Nanoarchaeota archaeon]